MKRSLRLIAVSLILLASIPGCKKSSGGSDNNNNNSEYYLTATVAGKAWAANVNNSALHSPCTGVLVRSGNDSIVLALGVQAQGKDSTAIVLVFPSKITLGQETKFDASKYSEGAYATMTAGYNTLPANKGSGNITISSFDRTAKVIEGTFTGTFGFVNGGATTVKITDGKFRCIYTMDANANPFPPNVKF